MGGGGRTEATFENRVVGDDEQKQPQTILKHGLSLCFVTDPLTKTTDLHKENFKCLRIFHLDFRTLFLG